MPNRRGYRIGMPSDEYWAQRATETLSESFLESAQSERYITKQYRNSLKALIRDYSDLVAPYTVNGEIDIDRMQTAMANSRAFAGRLRRVEKEIGLMADQLTQKEQKRILKSLTATYRNTVIKTLDGFVSTPGLEILHTKAVRNAVTTPWTADGREFSQRIWQKNQKLNKELRRILSDSITNGKSIQKTTREFRTVMSNTTYNSARIVRTETIAIYNRSQLDSYKELGVTSVKILDSQSGHCDECSKWNGTIVEIADAKVGVTIPPRHPNCKGRILPVID